MPDAEFGEDDRGVAIGYSGGGRRGDAQAREPLLQNQEAVAGRGGLGQIGPADSCGGVALAQGMRARW